MGAKGATARRFVCQTEGCGKSFNRRDYLFRHEANHSDVKPFSCAQCQLGFSRKDILEKHYKSQTHQDKRSQLTNKHKNLRFKSFTTERNQTDDHVAPEMVELYEVSVHESPEEGIVPNISPTDNTLNWLFGDDFELENDHLEQIMSQPENVDVEPQKKPGSGTLYEKLNHQTLLRVATKLEAIGVEVLYREKFDLYLLNFYIYFNSIYPIIHQPTFDPNLSNTWLLITMLSIGMTFTNDNNEYMYSADINKNLRLNLFSEIGDSPLVELELLQAILLENYYGKLMGTSNQTKISQIFHGTSINLLKYAGYFSNLKEPDVNVEEFESLDATQKEKIWRDWIFYETCKRTAFFGFLLDSHHASLFRHSQLLSIFEIHLELPCTDQLWNSKNYSSFIYEYSRQPNELLSRSQPHWDTPTKLKQETLDSKKSYSKPTMLDIEQEGNWPSFLWGLRRLMQPYKKTQKEYGPNCFSQFSRMILLHGVLSITWDLKCRSLTDLGFVSKRSLSALIGRLNMALTNWKGYFEIQIKFTNMASFEKDGKVVLNNYDVSNVFWNSITLYQFASIVLNVETSLIFDTVTGFIRESQNPEINSDSCKTRNKQKIQAWTRSKSSTAAIISCCKIIYTTINNPDIIKTIPHSIWALYISCLTIWAYETNVEIKLSISTTDSIPTISTRHYYRFENADINDIEQIDHDQAREKVNDYIMSILDKEDSEKESDDSGLTNNRTIECYWKCQRELMALIVLVFYILKGAKWKSSITMTNCLEKLLTIYE